MPFGLFKPQPLLDEPTIDWMFDVFAWAMRNFDADVFREETILVLPTNEHFPGRVDGPEGMARLIFRQVTEYAGMAHWPFELMPENACVARRPIRVAIKGSLRGAAGVAVEAVEEADRLRVTYDTHQTRSPEALIATFAHTIALYLAPAAEEAPPGGADNWPHITELLAVFMGFGLMFANSAYTAPSGGCGGCGGPATARDAYLSQYDITYALAIFAVLKAIPVKAVVPHLKRPLRPFFKKAYKDVCSRQDLLRRVEMGGQPLTQVK